MHERTMQVPGVFACIASDIISSRGGGRLKGVFKQSLSVQVCMQLPIQHSGICNAIAFWFELDLDEQTQLSTSPYCEKVLLYSIGHSQYFASLYRQRLHIIMLKHAADHCASLSPSAMYLSPQFSRCLSLVLDNPYGPVLFAYHLLLGGILHCWEIYCQKPYPSNSYLVQNSIP